MTAGKPGPAVWLATALGAGYLPWAPGTAGSAVGVAIALAVYRLHWEHARTVLGLALLVVILFLLGVWVAGRAERYFGRTDPGQVVIDEVAGQLITFLAVSPSSWKWALAGFALFRFFDVLKPFPARRAEHLPGGWGIMTDDVVAGVYALASLLILGSVVR